MKATAANMKTGTAIIDIATAELRLFLESELVLSVSVVGFVELVTNGFGKEPESIAPLLGELVSMLVVLVVIWSP